MGDWKRSTHECSLNDFLPEAIAAINKHIEQYNLGAILSDATLCIETKNEKTKKGLFGSAEVIIADVALTPRWLVWAIKDGKGVISVVSAQLTNIVVTDYSRSETAKLIQDTGVEVTGEFTGMTNNLPLEQRGSIFIGLGCELIAKKFLDMLIKAVQDAKK